MVIAELGIVSVVRRNLAGDVLARHKGGQAGAQGGAEGLRGQDGRVVNIQGLGFGEAIVARDAQTDAGERQDDDVAAFHVTEGGVSSGFEPMKEPQREER